MRSPRPMDAERVMPVSIVTSALRVKSNSAAIDPWDVFFLLIPKFAPRGTTSLTKTNSLPLKRDYFNRKCIFQPLILRGHVGIPGEYWFSSSKAALLIVFGGFWLGGSRCFQEIAKKIGSGKGKSKLGIS